MRFVSRSVITGFVNALAILIFLAQLPELIGASWLVYVLVVAGLAIIYLLPLLTRAIPSPLVCIVLLSALALRSEEHKSELQSLMRISYDVFCLKTKKRKTIKRHKSHTHDK